MKVLASYPGDTKPKRLLIKQTFDCIKQTLRNKMQPDAAQGGELLSASENL